MHDDPNGVFHECVPPPHGGGTHPWGHRLEWVRVLGGILNVMLHVNVQLFQNINLLVVQKHESSQPLFRRDLFTVHGSHQSWKRSSNAPRHHEVSLVGIGVSDIQLLLFVHPRCLRKKLQPLFSKSNLDFHIEHVDTASWLWEMTWAAGLCWHQWISTLSDSFTSDSRWGIGAS